MSDPLKPLDEITKNQWRECAVHHEERAFQKGKKIKTLESQNQSLREALEGTTRALIPFARHSQIEQIRTNIRTAMNHEAVKKVKELLEEENERHQD